MKKRTPRRLELSKSTIIQLDPDRLRTAQGAVALTGCVGGCNSAFPCLDKAG